MFQLLTCIVSVLNSACREEHMNAVHSETQQAEGSLQLACEMLEQQSSSNDCVSQSSLLSIACLFVR